MVLTGVIALSATGCAADEDASPTPTPSVVESPTPVISSQPRLALVDPSIVAGLDTRAVEDYGPGRLVYASLPELPGAEAFTDEVQLVVDEDIDRFVADTEPSEQAPYPELLISWDLVAASPQVIGVRIRTTEYNAEGDDGRTATAWYDVEAETASLGSGLIADDQVDELAGRVRAAAAGDARIDPDLLDVELARGADAFDAIAYTPDGDLFVEFDEGLVAGPEHGPVAVAVDATGLRTDLGAVAESAALTPSDPAVEPSEPQPTAPAPTVTAPTAVPVPGPADGVDCAAVQCVALTFDDGPVEDTARLLDILASKGVPATFFVTGNHAQAQPDLLGRMAAEGHAIGNHTFDHPQLTRLDAAAIRDEIGRTNDIVESASGVRPVLLRPPYGATDDNVAAVSADLGMAQIMWDVDPEDWKDHDAGIVRQRVLEATGVGDIVLSHDIHPTTIDAYSDIIDDLTAEGYRLVTVPTLLGGDMVPGQVYYNQ